MKGSTRRTSSSSASPKGSGILALVFTLSLSLSLYRHVVVLADELSPPATPCVASRTVDDATVQSDVALGCQEVVDVTSAVCTDYLSQQLPLAISQFCGNQSEAYAYCLSLPDTSSSSALDCIGFDPSGATDTSDGEVYPSCTQAALDTYSLCGNGSISGDYFATGDLISLTQCLFLNLDLCTPEDGEGHFSVVFEGGLTDCPIPAYTPACGVFSTTAAGSSGGTTTAAAATASSSAAAPTSDPAAAASSSAAPSSQSTEPGSPSSTAVSTSPLGSPPLAAATTTTTTKKSNSNSMGFPSRSCPLGQTLIAYTTIIYF